MIKEEENLRHQRRRKCGGHKLLERHTIGREFPVRPTLPGVLDIDHNLVFVLANVAVLDVHADPVSAILRRKQQLDSFLTLDLGPPELRIDLQLPQGVDQVLGQGS